MGRPTFDRPVIDRGPSGFGEADPNSIASNLQAVTVFATDGIVLVPVSYGTDIGGHEQQRPLSVPVREQRVVRIEPGPFSVLQHVGNSLVLEHRNLQVRG